eukprot:TRINITY_DN2313_c0_g2_i2.p1 TRINITY_DN2313_c0_g2~~TRINITY_DN2313_c0_g2_i2.p1  ORF type:complete len:199 (+),score=31.77 TRINITY_DN2313_c0_g2_i2:36-599(+)
MNPEAFTKLWQACDTNASGTLDERGWTQFVLSLLATELSLQGDLSRLPDTISQHLLQQVSQMFREVDADGDGFVSHEEVQYWIMTRFQSFRDDFECLNLDEESSNGDSPDPHYVYFQPEPPVADEAVVVKVKPEQPPKLREKKMRSEKSPKPQKPKGRKRKVAKKGLIATGKVAGAVLVVLFVVVLI